MKLAMVIVGLLIFYLFFRFVLLVEWNEIDKLKVKLNKSRIDLQLAESKIKVFEVFEAKTGVRAVAPPASKEQRSLEVLQALSEATSKSHLNLISIRPDLSLREGMRFELAATGSYANLYEFLGILRELKILISIDELNVSGEDVRNPKLEVRMLITAHY